MMEIDAQEKQLINSIIATIGEERTWVAAKRQELYDNHMMERYNLVETMPYSIYKKFNQEIYMVLREICLEYIGKL